MKELKYTQLEAFKGLLENGLKNDSLIKVTLSLFHGRDELKNIYIRPLELKEGPHCQFTYRYNTKDITKNYTYKTTLNLISDFLKESCRNADADLADHTISYKRLKSGKEKLNKTESKRAHSINKDHNKSKHLLIPSEADFLRHLGLSDENGRIKDKAQRKFKQINRFIEILDQHFKKSEISEPIKLTDMGSGKGYLTFSMYYYFSEILKKECTIKGVELRKDLVNLCNTLSRELGYTGLTFQEGSIEASDIDNENILVALHACDTATDDAIAKGINAGCPMIITSPCCHKEMRKNIKSTDSNKPLFKNGIIKERWSEMITDVLRSLILEKHAYDSKIIEFTDAENTAKNMMIIAIKNNKPVDKDKREIDLLKETYGIDSYYLETLVS